MTNHRFKPGDEVITVFNESNTKNEYIMKSGFMFRPEWREYCNGRTFVIEDRSCVLVIGDRTGDSIRAYKAKGHPYWVDEECLELSKINEFDTVGLEDLL